MLNIERWNSIWKGEMQFEKIKAEFERRNPIPTARSRKARKGFLEATTSLKKPLRLPHSDIGCLLQLTERGRDFSWDWCWWGMPSCYHSGATAVVAGAALWCHTGSVAMFACGDHVTSGAHLRANCISLCRLTRESGGGGRRACSKEKLAWCCPDEVKPLTVERPTREQRNEGIRRRRRTDGQTDRRAHGRQTNTDEQTDRYRHIVRWADGRME